MKKLLLIPLALVLVGCEPSMKEVKKDLIETNKIGYVKDDRTNLCFGVILYERYDAAARAASGLAFTHVPCTPSVEMLLVK